MVTSKNYEERDLINEYLELTSGPVHFMMPEGGLWSEYPDRYKFRNLNIVHGPFNKGTICEVQEKNIIAMKLYSFGRCSYSPKVTTTRQ